MGGDGWREEGKSILSRYAVIDVTFVTLVKSDMPHAHATGCSLC